MLPLEFFLPKRKPFRIDPLAPLGVSFNVSDRNETDQLDNLSLENELIAFKASLATHPLMGGVVLPQQATTTAAPSPAAEPGRPVRRASTAEAQFEVSDPSEEEQQDDVMDEYPESLIEVDGQYFDEISEDVSLDVPPRR